jgi:hypothetical protein
MGVLQWHRRHALTLASQLPDNQADALLVLEAMRELVQHYLADDAESSERAQNVIPFGKNG